MGRRNKNGQSCKDCGLPVGSNGTQNGQRYKCSHCGAVYYSTDTEPTLSQLNNALNKNEDRIKELERQIAQLQDLRDKKGWIKKTIEKFEQLIQECRNEHVESDNTNNNHPEIMNPDESAIQENPISTVDMVNKLNPDYHYTDEEYRKFITEKAKNTVHNNKKETPIKKSRRINTSKDIKNKMFTIRQEINEILKLK
jgi:hypothetical protein